MITKYRAALGCAASLIKRVEVDKETEAFVFIGGRRYSKQTLFDNYFDSFAEAKAFLLDDAKTKIIQAYESVGIARDYKVRVDALKE